MDYTAVACPNCGSDIKLDSNLDKGFCMYCGSQVVLNTDTGDASLLNLLKIIRRDLKNGRNQTQEFRDRLNTALNSAPNNAELRTLYENEIWNATIDGDMLLSYTGDVQKFVVPSYITKIGSYAFSSCSNLRHITIPDSVKYIGEDIFSDSNNIIIDTPNNTCAHKYAIAHSIKMKCKDTELADNISKNIKEIVKLRYELIDKKDQGTKHIKEHYDKMYNSLKEETSERLSHNATIWIIKFDTIILTMLMFGILFTIYGFKTWETINILLGIVLFIINIPFLSKIGKNEKLKSMKHLLDHKYRDIFKWNINFNKRFEDSYLMHTTKHSIWNKDDAELTGEIKLLKNTIAKVEKIDVTKVISIEDSYDVPPISITVSENLTTREDLQQILNSFRPASQDSTFEVRLNGYQPFSQETANNLMRYTGMMVINIDNYICFVDTKKICSITGLSKNRVMNEIASIKHNGTSKLDNLKSALSCGRTCINNCSNIYEAELLMAQVFSFLPEHIHIYKGTSKLF